MFGEKGRLYVLYGHLNEGILGDSGRVLVFLRLGQENDKINMFGSFF